MYLSEFKNYMVAWTPGGEDRSPDTELAHRASEYVGWVEPNPKIPGTWLCNWKVLLGVFGVGTWADPFAGDSGGHVHPTREAAKAAVESKLNELRNQ